MQEASSSCSSGALRLDDQTDKTGPPSHMLNPLGKPWKGSCPEPLQKLFIHQLSPNLSLNIEPLKWLVFMLIVMLLNPFCLLLTV